MFRFDESSVRIVSLDSDDIQNLNKTIFYR